ncbi:DUF4126 domain-containing protein [soil metagenome]
MEDAGGLTMLQTAALAAGLSWASGIRLYATVFLAGVLAHFGMFELPSGLAVLTHPWVVGTSGVLMVGEFCADKIPAFDSVWDAVHTFIRIPAGALLAAGSFGHADPALMVAAGLIGGTLATGSHLAKSATRATANLSPEPFSNWGLSLLEDVAAPFGVMMAMFAPIAALVLVLLFIVLAIWLVPKLVRVWRAMLQRLRTA